MMSSCMRAAQMLVFLASAKSATSATVQQHDDFQSCVAAPDDCTYLLLDDNQLTGSIPSELAALTNLTSMNLGNNLLIGTIPSELAALIYLTDMVLAYNQLTGTIPRELKALESLEKMHLQFNKLSGSIPCVLGALTSLSSLLLCNNSDLCGDVPAGMTLGAIPGECSTSTTGTRLGAACPPLTLPGSSCLAPVDLAEQTSPYIGDTSSSSDFVSDMLVASGAAKDMVFTYMLQSNDTILLWQRNNSFDSVHELRYSGACPGDVVLQSVDDLASFPMGVRNPLSYPV
eukprot:CAMPEP_0114254602 /NCGR_PEP_ID=MMETSP0058-20121206/17077_1 /TAXON_ID=36894 /ORGANISM="Pyramimonas parkeae, CCMP726" /LENGTH=286 /DNA_ID=CAMNT_0001368853 /DNA_START=143 /DNA_END=999 /DNA_ORIENTATION=-